MKDNMTTKHTPGPWYVEKPFQEPGIYVAAKHSSALIAKLFPVDREYNVDALTSAEANATLIAAAPDLLEALRAIVKEYKNDLHNCIDSTVSDENIAAAEKAIAKAEGR